MNEKLANLRAHLTCKHNGAIAFVRAAESVLRGRGEPTAENAGQYGRNVFVASHDVYDPSPADLITGMRITIGTAETLGSVELRCYARAREACVALFRGDRVVSKVLTHSPAALPEHGTAYDEGLFTWFGPVEDICTPWNDNDPPHCQVLTIEDLRVFGSSM